MAAFSGTRRTSRVDVDESQKHGGRRGRMVNGGGGSEDTEEGDDEDVMAGDGRG